MWFKALLITFAIGLGHGVSAKDVTLVSTEYPPYFGPKLPEGGPIA